MPADARPTRAPSGRPSRTGPLKDATDPGDQIQAAFRPRVLSRVDGGRSHVRPPRPILWWMGRFRTFRRWRDGTGDKPWTVWGVLMCALAVPAGLVTVHAQPASASRNPKPALRIAHSARAVRPGEVVLLRVDAAEPLDTLEGRAFGRPLEPWSVSPTRWLALVGISREAKPGSAVVRLTATTVAGRPLSRAYRLAVGPRRFPVRGISLDPRYLEPPAEVLDRIAAEQERVREAFARSAPEALWARPFVMPASTPVTSRYGILRIINRTRRQPHLGLDLGGDIGTPVVAPNRGRVALATELYFTGNTVVLDHGLGLFSTLAHLSRIAVGEGDTVERGDLVGEVGDTGRVTGPHLHWTLRLGGIAVDPESILALPLEPSAEPGEAPGLPSADQRAPK